ncbi:hypothetical protein [Rhodococcus rhodochrous]|uniref:hypothetical protein n=1 Tax=Rhodococcus rhodochrous TaxID=1829 RepID=UPI0011AE5AA3|nr:hypothetical protein [Rhodococcus rhodochrous]
MDAKSRAAPLLRPSRPTIYLDLWVWIRLAKAAQGGPIHPGDLVALEALRAASRVGVAFPLSATHYEELHAITDPRQRLDVARTMAEISYMRTLRSPSVLVRHQLKCAMHQHLGRPAFRPKGPEVLGIGVQWAFVGEQGRLTLRGDDELVAQMEKLLPISLTELNQWAEFRVLAGPRDEDVPGLRVRGYDPESVQEKFKSRISYEMDLATQIARGAVKRSELRVVVQARELSHEHLPQLSELFAEYNLTIDGAFGTDPRRAKRNRKALSEFVDSVPSIRVAVDLKHHYFRNAQKPWSSNAVRDIDALGAALPYCDVVVADKEMGSLLSRSKVADDLGMTVVTTLPALLDLLPPLVERANELGGDRTGWGNSAGFRLDTPPGFQF